MDTNLFDSVKAGTFDNTVLKPLGQSITSGGIHTPPALRLLLYSLAVMCEAKTILETGYDAGTTTEILAKTGAVVFGVDDLSEYGEVDKHAREKLDPYPNCVLVNEDAIKFIRSCPDEYFDFAFIDDKHYGPYVEQEAEELPRIIKPGGVVVFHDTKLHKLFGMLVTKLQWDHVQLPCVSPAAGRDFGVTIFTKPI